MLTAKVYDKKGPILIITGLFSAPILGAALPAVWGLVIGNAILSAGWVMVGIERFRCDLDVLPMWQTEPKNLKF